jgi:hypothetical protein
MKQNLIIRAVLIAACVAVAVDTALGEASQTNSGSDEKPSQALSLNVSQLPIAKYLYRLADAAYHPKRFQQAENEKLIAAEEGRYGFKALAVEVTFGGHGEQKVAIIAYSGTDVFSPDMFETHRLR